MQFMNKFSFSTQELSHAQWAIETGNFDTELGKSIQRKLLGLLVGTSKYGVALPAIVATDLMENHHLHFSLGLIENDNSEAIQLSASAADNIAFVCDFIIPAEEVAELENLDTDALANCDIFAEWLRQRKKAEMIKHCDEMWRMCQYEGVESFDAVNTDAVDLADGSIHVTFGVVPVYKIH